MSGIGKSIETGSRLVVAREEHGVYLQVIDKEYGISLGDDVNCIKLILILVAQLCIY